MIQYEKDGKIVDSTDPLQIGRQVIFNASPEQWFAAGYRVHVEQEAPRKPEVFKFDRYKVMTALGDGWELKAEELKAAGLYDYFMGSPYLSTGDPLFLQVYWQLTPEERMILKRECRWDG